MIGMLHAQCFFFESFCDALRCAIDVMELDACVFGGCVLEGTDQTYVSTPCKSQVFVCEGPVLQKKRKVIVIFPQRGTNNPMPSYQKKTFTSPAAKGSICMPFRPVLLQHKLIFNELLHFQSIFLDCMKTISTRTIKKNKRRSGGEGGGGGQITQRQLPTSCENT